LSSEKSSAPTVAFLHHNHFANIEAVRKLCSTGIDVNIKLISQLDSQQTNSFILFHFVRIDTRLDDLEGLKKEAEQYMEITDGNCVWVYVFSLRSNPETQELRKIPSGFGTKTKYYHFIQARFTTDNSPDLNILLVNVEELCNEIQSVIKKFDA